MMEKELLLFLIIPCIYANWFEAPCGDDVKINSFQAAIGVFNVRNCVMCASMCAEEEDCQAFNFINGSVCELFDFKTTESGDYLSLQQGATYYEKLVEDASGKTLLTISCLESFSSTVATDCKELFDGGEMSDGIYSIQPTGAPWSFSVRCDFTNGGWTYFQERRHASDSPMSFDHDWAGYKAGFGDLEAGDYWLGNEYIHWITSMGNHRIRVDTLLQDGSVLWIEYSDFSIGNELTKYEAVWTSFADGNFDNNYWDRANNVKFTTTDEMNSPHGNNCALNAKGGWWWAYPCSYEFPNSLFGTSGSNMGAYTSVNPNVYRYSEDYSIKIMRK